MGRRITVPYHRRELAPKTLNSILKQAGVSREEFSSLL
jgi:predicted RNA binding protein YcfA (HicA-like mRNA interferase family)